MGCIVRIPTRLRKPTKKVYKIKKNDKVKLTLTKARLKGTVTKKENGIINIKQKENPKCNKSSGCKTQEIKIKNFNIKKIKK